MFLLNFSTVGGSGNVSILFCAWITLRRFIWKENVDVVFCNFFMLQQGAVFLCFLIDWCILKERTGSEAVFCFRGIKRVHWVAGTSTLRRSTQITWTTRRRCPSMYFYFSDRFCLIYFSQSQHKGTQYLCVLDTECVVMKFVPAGLPSSMESRCLKAGKHDASKRPMRRQNWTASGRRSVRWGETGCRKTVNRQTTDGTNCKQAVQGLNEL